MTTPPSIARPTTSQVACTACRLKSLCLAATPTASGAGARFMHRTQLRAGEVLFKHGAPQTALYAVHAGFMKTVKPLPDGRSHVVGLHLMGDAMGLEGLASRVHGTEAVALASCNVCVIPLSQADRVMELEPASALHIRNLLSDQLALASERFVALGSLTAHQRIAAFLLDLSDRWKERGYSARQFDLCMTRKEIGSYVGLTYETVSRMMSDFDSRGWVAVDGRHVELLNRPALEALLRASAA